jgi:DNA-binding beta-propeller fold protein YncE
MLFRSTSGAALAAAGVLTFGGAPAARPEATVLDPMLAALAPSFCLMDQRGAAPQTAKPFDPLQWPGEGTRGGDIEPLRLVYDPYPTYDGLAVDSENGLVVMTDENRSGVLTYDRTSGGDVATVTEPRRHIFGPDTNMGFMAGVTLDPQRREIYAVSNDGGGLSVFPYDGHGNVEPIRRLTPPHQAWGLSLGLKRDELAVTSQQNHGFYVFRRTATGADLPLRTVRGPRSRLADPHGIVLDEVNNEIIVANHGNWTELRSYAADGPLVMDKGYVAGKFYPPSVTVFSATADGDVPPVRAIQGPNTLLNWPMGVAIDHERNEIAVANYGTNSILFFRRSDSGDVAPVRVLAGPETGVVGPIGIGIDVKHNELWIANYGDHTAVVFDRGASGSAAPKRIVRNAPKGTPTTGFTNASAGAYDGKRGQVLVPN